MEEDLFSILTNQQLSSVVFVQDYLQLDFDGNRMTLYVWPTLEIQCRVRRFGDIEYRNDLCSFIAKKIRQIEWREHESLLLHFLETSDTIRVDLSAGYEAVYFTENDSTSWLTL